MVIVALVKAKSVIWAVQFALGQPACWAVGCAGGLVVTANDTVPFFTCDEGIAWLPVTLTEAGFWPGAWLPPLFVQVAVGLAVAVRVTRMSPLPRPASEPFPVNVSPLSVKEGVPLKLSLIQI